MDMNALASLVGRLGFPIVACFYMAWNHEKESQRHNEETMKTVEAINNNTVALTKLAERLDNTEEYHENMQEW